MMVLTTITGITFVASPAPALAACTTNGCTGLDPQVQGCTGARTMPDPIWYTSGDLIYSVQLRQSPVCQSMWARLVVDYNADPLRTMYVRVQRQLYNNQQLEWQASGDYTAPIGIRTGTTWTDMVADYASGDRARACIRFGTGGSWSCTSWQ
ncbi:MAG TPA: DUF2690 domain-containing protein [Actinoplanes sp.]|nr:DUF2690 domain-containing protein [Actinoplanes sp.]